MVFTRTWDSSCPREWVRWETDDATWTITDLPPEQDEEALRLLVEDFLPDEVLCSSIYLHEEPESVKGISDFWRMCIAQRMSLACYHEKDGIKTLAGLNVCLVKCDDDEDIPVEEIEGARWRQVYGSLLHMEEKGQEFKSLGVDKLLSAVGLVVRREYRGAKLGSKILDARRAMSLAYGVTASATMFTGPASQRSAERSGFRTILAMSMKELSDLGLGFPKDENRIIKIMGINYV